MALLSLLLSLAAGITAVLGAVATLVPGVGAVLSFLAPALALGGIVVGGVAMSRARREGKSRDVAVVAVVLNVLAFFPALMVATTCGVCSAILANGPVHVRRSFHVNMGYPRDLDGGVSTDLPGDPRTKGLHDPPPIVDEADGADGAPAVPPPPLPPGPTPR